MHPIKEKPVVNYYQGTLTFYISYLGKEHASCWATNHPNPMIYSELVATSEVIRKEPDGTFETKNTVYTPIAKPVFSEPFTQMGGDERCNYCGSVAWAIRTRPSKHTSWCPYPGTMKN